MATQSIYYVHPRALSEISHLFGKNYTGFEFMADVELSVALL